MSPFICITFYRRATYFPFTVSYQKYRIHYYLPLSFARLRVFVTRQLTLSRAATYDNFACAETELLWFLFLLFLASRRHSDYSLI